MQVLSTRFNLPNLAVTMVYVTLHGLIIASSYWLLVSPFSSAGAHYWPHVLAGFVGVCWLPCFSLSYFLQLFAPIRRPLIAEERLFAPALRAVTERLGNGRSYKIWMTEAPDIGAYATGRRTIVLNTGMLPVLSSEELSGILAHEIGHLQAYDCMFQCPRYIEDRIAQAIRLASRWCWRNLANKAWKRWGILIVLTTLLLLCWQGRFLPVLAGLFTPAIGLRLLKHPLHLLVLAESRYTEYRQDAFAQRLGYGKALIRVNQKVLAEGGLQVVSRWSLLWHSTHPLLHHRIRRLQELEACVASGSHCNATTPAVTNN